MVNINKLMKQAQEMQEKIAREMAELQVEVSSGGGAVTVVMNGTKELVNLSIKKEAVDPDAKVMSLACHPTMEEETDMGQIHHDQCQTISAGLRQNQGPRQEAHSVSSGSIAFRAVAGESYSGGWRNINSTKTCPKRAGSWLGKR